MTTTVFSKKKKKKNYYTLNLKNINFLILYTTENFNFYHHQVIGLRRKKANVEPYSSKDFTFQSKMKYDYVIRKIYYYS